MTWREWLRYRRMVSRLAAESYDQGYSVSPQALVLIKQQCRAAVLDNAKVWTHTPVWVPNDQLAAVQAQIARARAAQAVDDFRQRADAWAARWDARQRGRQPSNNAS